MQAFISGILSNKILLISAAAWLVAQICKTLIHYIVHRKLSWERMWASGGMPSSHSATVCALVITTCSKYGPASFEFAFSLLFAIVVLHDARGVRLETGKQSEILNRLIHNIENGRDILQGQELKELIGHTPFQVLIGSIIGIGVALVLL